ncbi:MAG: hypothetical protein ACREHV_01375 [Rhizomicrobium sp.]
MADPIKSMPEANAAYQAALAALQSVHEQLDEITSASPVDWNSYNAGLQSCTACQSSAQAALGVFQEVILNTTAVQELVGKLTGDTQAMNQAAGALDKTTATFNALASVATTLTAVLTTILKFV